MHVSVHLSPGARLGPYEIMALIGEGGMGEVYRARDTRLGRDVAVKVSREQFSQRFEREARAVAALNHPHICQLYDVGPNYLVMELVEGAPVKGPLPLDVVLKLAGQLAGAMEAAHRKSITHHDLKPANILNTKSGIKVLDFGLAKFEPTGPTGPDDATVTQALTREGAIVGTLQYMPPEQLSGKEVDSRADIFSFGCVLYEMLTGKRAFDGATAASVIGAILEREAPSVADVAPAALDRLLKRCLAKDPDDRWQTARDIRAELEWIASGGGLPAAGAEGVPIKARSTWLAWGLVVVLTLVVAALAFVHFLQTPPMQQSIRFQIATPGAAAADFLTLSPDGRMLAFVANNGGPSQVWVRALDTLEARALAGTNGATFPFWSPDGAWLGFFAQGKLKKIAVAGGTPQTLCDAPTGLGGAWNREGVILFSAGPTSPILRVAGTGGVPSPVTTIAQGASDRSDRFPVFLPDGIHFLYEAASDKADASGVYAASLNRAAGVRILPDDTNAVYAPPAVPDGSGYLLFRREDTLMAQPFDPSLLKATGEMFPVAERVPFSNLIGFGAFSISESGTLVYRSGDVAAGRELVWMDRAGKRLGVVGKPAAYGPLAISPDERKVAMQIAHGSGSDIWLEDFAQGVLSRLTFRLGVNAFPVWSPDGSRVAFTFISLNPQSYDIYQKPAAGNGQEELLVHAGGPGFPEDWSPDGRSIVYMQFGQKTGMDLWLLPLDGERKPTPYLQTPSNELNAHFSPDGKWMAYASNETGQYQVYVQAIPANGAKYQISAAGGEVPEWRRDGKEIYYISPDQKLMAVPIKLGSRVEPGTPQPLFPVSAVPIPPAPFVYVPSGDGQRFLVNALSGGESAAAAPPITVVLNWQAAIKKK